ncbi:MAG: electron transport complex subunit RsxC [Halieaceae bacterium]|jgi:Na+-translocating ferredoxin:NAD+ oxidoreductase subunit C|nr:electron transport complex subunit RsxC [Halieaceae bacterium]
MKNLLSFRNGVHPPENKDITAGIRSRRFPFPSEVVLPLSQHIGAPAKSLVQQGDIVERGDVIAQAGGYVSSAVHASASGTVTSTEFWPHPNGGMVPSIRIAVDPNSTQMPRPRIIPQWSDVADEDLSAQISRAGIVGLGGAAFPSHVKLNPPKDQPIDVLLINGCECEPYLTSDHRTMLERPEKVHMGIRIALKALGIKRAVIGIEANKPDAIDIMRQTAPDDLDVTVQALEVKYPQGAEKMLIKAVTGREVPSGALPSAVGALVQNVATSANIAMVFETGQPLIERIITVTGRGIAEPGNWIIPFGTKLRDVIAHCGGLTDEAREIVYGGPMMGIAQASMDVPVLKGTGGILVLSQEECKRQDILPCIRCGKCLEACPVFLNPQLLGAMARVERYEEMAEEAHLQDCMLCGCCSYVCPSNIPLSQLFALSKNQLTRLATP